MTVLGNVAASKGGMFLAGKQNIATNESRTNTAYGLMTTADRVQSVVLPTDGLIVLMYQAEWQETVQATAAAAIFIGANQFQFASTATNAPAAQNALMNSATLNIDQLLFSCPGGLASTQMTTAYTSDVTTGQAVGVADLAGTTTNQSPGGRSAAYNGGPCYAFAAAGTYDVSIQFKASSGTVSVKNRKLWVWTMDFS